MSEFEDNLWFEVKREFARSGAPAAHRHRRMIPRQLIAGTTVGLAAIATATALLFDASTSPPAFAVTRNPNGTVTVNLLKLSGIAGANQKLAAMGVRAQIQGLPKSGPKLVCPSGTAPTITIDPAAVPSHGALLITPGQASAGGAATPRGAGNHVVRILPSGSQVRTGSGDDNHVVRMSCS